MKRFISGLLLIASGEVNATGTLILNETFTTSALNDPSSWALSYSGTQPCLTAKSSSSVAQVLAIGSMVGCSNPSPYNTTDASESGTFQLTNASQIQSGTLLYNTAMPTSGGLDISFLTSQWGGNGADGISFYTKDGRNTSTNPGPTGGALGYAQVNGTTPGIHGALFGVGLDVYGSFSTSTYGGSACSNQGTGGTRVLTSVVVRGEDTSNIGVSPYGTGLSTSGFCFLGGTNTGVVPHGSNRSNGTFAVRIIVDPPTVTATRKIRVYTATSLSSISGALTTDANGSYVASASATLTVDAPNIFYTVPSFKFGFSASTGGSTDYHQVWTTSVNSVNPLTVTVTADNAASAPGSALASISYTYVASSGTPTFVSSPSCSAYTDNTYSTLVSSSTVPGSYVTHCSGGVATGYAFSYVDGVYTVGTAAPAAVPTLSEWAQLMLGLMVISMLGWHFYRERSY